MDKINQINRKRERIGQNIKIKKYDDIFDDGINTPEESNIENGTVFVKIYDLQDFKDHPFKLTGKGINELTESIREHGILSPIIVRPVTNGLGKYEIISGHRRKYCAVELGMEHVPVIIRDIDDDDAVLAMVDSNIQREDILPSERAFAYKMKLEAIKRQGKRTDLTSGQFVQKSDSSEMIGKESNESGRQIRRYIRLTALTQHFLNAIDSKKMSVNAGVLLSYLGCEEINMVEYATKETRRFPSLNQAKKIRELSMNNNEVTADGIIEILLAGKNNGNADVDRYINFRLDKIKDYFPDGYTGKQIEEEIIKMLKDRTTKNVSD